MERRRHSMKTPAGSSTEVEYPSSDGERMSENQWQLWAMIDTITMLQAHFADRPAHATGDLLIYYEEGNPRARVAPDVFVILGAPKHPRMNYKLWEEPGGPPDFVLEVVASANTHREALGWKRALYARLGMREYWQFDPTGEYLAPALQGLRLHGGDYRPIPVRPETGGRILPSDALGLDLRVEKGKLRFHDPESGEDLLTHGEMHDAIQKIRVRNGEIPGDRARSPVRLRDGELPDHVKLARILRSLRAREAAEARAREEILARRAGEADLAKLNARIRELEAKIREREGGRTPGESAPRAEST